MNTIWKIEIKILLAINNILDEFVYCFRYYFADGMRIFIYLDIKRKHRHVFNILRTPDIFIGLRIFYTDACIHI